MADVIGVLNRKRASLNSQKQQIRAEADRKTAKIDAELADVDRAIKTLNDAVKEYLRNGYFAAGQNRDGAESGRAILLWGTRPFRILCTDEREEIVVR